MHYNVSKFVDEVKFGEVVKAPPHLQAKPRGSQSHSKTLLLHQKITPSPHDPLVSKPRSRAPTVGLKRKKDLEIEREHAISVYRQRKRQTFSKK